MGTSIILLLLLRAVGFVDSVIVRKVGHKPFLCVCWSSFSLFGLTVNCVDCN